MNREQREKANQAMRERLLEKLEANRGGLRIEDLMGRGREESEEHDAPPEEGGNQRIPTAAGAALPQGAWG